MDAQWKISHVCIHLHTQYWCHNRNNKLIWITELVHVWEWNTRRAHRFWRLSTVTCHRVQTVLFSAFASLDCLSVPDGCRVTCNLLFWTMQTDKMIFVHGCRKYSTNSTEKWERDIGLRRIASARTLCVVAFVLEHWLLSCKSHMSIPFYRCQ